MTYTFHETSDPSSAVYDTSLMSAPVLDTTVGSPTFGKWISTVDTSTRRVNSFYVKGTNEYGYSEMSSVIRVHVVTNCDYD